MRWLSISCKRFSKQKAKPNGQAAFIYTFVSLLRLWGG